MELRFFDDPVPFLDQAGDHLAARPVLSTVLAGVAASDRTGRSRDRLARGRALLVRLGAEAPRRRRRRCGPRVRRPTRPYLMPMPDEAAVALADALARPRRAAWGSERRAPGGRRSSAEDMATPTGRADVRIAQQTRLFELGDLVEPGRSTGRLRPARPDELAIVGSWYDAFMADADEQAGQAAGSSFHESPDRGGARVAIETGSIWIVGRRRTTAGPPDRRQTPVVRRDQDRAGLHHRGQPGPRLRAARRGTRCRSGSCDGGRTAVPVHRPGQPHLQQDLRGDRLPPLVDMANLVVG